MSACYSFDLYFSSNSWYGTFFHCLFPVIYAVFFGDMSIKIFTPFWLIVSHSAVESAQCLAEGLGTLKVFGNFVDGLIEWMILEWDFLEKSSSQFSIRRGRGHREKILIGSQALFPLSKLEIIKLFLLWFQETCSFDPHDKLARNMGRYLLFIIPNEETGVLGGSALAQGHTAIDRPRSSPLGISWSVLPYSRSRCPVGLS